MVDRGRVIGQEDVDRLRGWLERQHAPGADRSDEELREILEGAEEWIGGRRWSFTIVAANFLRDGVYHA
jgi:hypothetical protein